MFTITRSYFFLSICVLSFCGVFPFCSDTRTICVLCDPGITCDNCVNFTTTVDDALAFVGSDGGYQVYLVGYSNTNVMHVENVLIPEEKSSPHFSVPNYLSPYPGHNITIRNEESFKCAIEIHASWWNISSGQGTLSFYFKEGTATNGHILCSELSWGGLFLGPFEMNNVYGIVESYFIKIDLGVGRNESAYIIDGVRFSGFKVYGYIRTLGYIGNSPSEFGDIYGHDKRIWVKNCQFLVEDKTSVKPISGTTIKTYENNIFFVRDFGVFEVISNSDDGFSVYNNIFYFIGDFYGRVVRYNLNGDVWGVGNSKRFFNNLVISQRIHMYGVILLETDSSGDHPIERWLHFYNNLLVIDEDPGGTLYLVRWSQRNAGVCNATFGFNRVTVPYTQEMNLYMCSSTIKNDIGGTSVGEIDLDLSNFELVKDYVSGGSFNNADFPSYLPIPTTDMLGRPRGLGGTPPSLGPMEFQCPNSCLVDVPGKFDCQNRQTCECNSLPDDGFCFSGVSCNDSFDCDRCPDLSGETCGLSLCPDEKCAGGECVLNMQSDTVYCVSCDIKYYEGPNCSVPLFDTNLCPVPLNNPSLICNGHGSCDFTFDGRNPDDYFCECVNLYEGDACDVLPEFNVSLCPTDENGVCAGRGTCFISEESGLYECECTDPFEYSGPGGTSTCYLRYYLCYKSDTYCVEVDPAVDCGSPCTYSSLYSAVNNKAWGSTVYLVGSRNVTYTFYESVDADDVNGGVSYTMMMHIEPYPSHKVIWTGSPAFMLDTPHGGKYIRISSGQGHLTMTNDENDCLFSDGNIVKFYRGGSQDERRGIYLGPLTLINRCNSSSSTPSSLIYFEGRDDRCCYNDNIVIDGIVVDGLYPVENVIEMKYIYGGEYSVRSWPGSYGNGKRVWIKNSKFRIPFTKAVIHFIRSRVGTVESNLFEIGDSYPTTTVIKAEEEKDEGFRIFNNVFILKHDQNLTSSPRSCESNSNCSLLHFDCFCESGIVQFSGRQFFNNLVVDKMGVLDSISYVSVRDDPSKQFRNSFEYFNNLFDTTNSTKYLMLQKNDVNFHYCDISYGQNVLGCSNCEKLNDSFGSWENVTSSDTTCIETNKKLDYGGSLIESTIEYLNESTYLGVKKGYFAYRGYDLWGGLVRIGDQTTPLQSFPTHDFLGRKRRSNVFSKGPFEYQCPCINQTNVYGQVIKDCMNGSSCGCEYPPFFGDACQYVLNFSSCLHIGGVLCSGHGVCTLDSVLDDLLKQSYFPEDDTSIFSCNCTRGFRGAGCEIMDFEEDLCPRDPILSNQFSTSPCSGKGNCSRDYASGNYFCECFEGFAGHACQSVYFEECDYTYHFCVNVNSSSVSCSNCENGTLQDVISPTGPVGQKCKALGTRCIVYLVGNSFSSPLSPVLVEFSFSLYINDTSLEGQGNYDHQMNIIKPIRNHRIRWKNIGNSPQLIISTRHWLITQGTEGGFLEFYSDTKCPEIRIGREDSHDVPYEYDDPLSLKFGPLTVTNRFCGVPNSDTCDTNAFSITCSKLHPGTYDEHDSCVEMLVFEDILFHEGQISDPSVPVACSNDNHAVINMNSVIHFSHINSGDESYNSDIYIRKSRFLMGVSDAVLVWYDSLPEAFSFVGSIDSNVFYDLTKSSATEVLRLVDRAKIFNNVFVVASSDSSLKYIATQSSNTDPVDMVGSTFLFNLVYVVEESSASVSSTPLYSLLFISGTRMAKWKMFQNLIQKSDGCVSLFDGKKDLMISCEFEFRGNRQSNPSCDDSVWDQYQSNCTLYLNQYSTDGYNDQLPIPFRDNDENKDKYPQLDDLSPFMLEEDVPSSSKPYDFSWTRKDMLGENRGVGDTLYSAGPFEYQCPESCLVGGKEDCQTESCGCTDVYFGEKCTYRMTCPEYLDYGMCCSSVTHGYCYGNDSSAESYCVCHEGFNGTDCSNVQIDDCPTCFGRGRCVFEFETGEKSCICDDPGMYGGRYCERWKCIGREMDDPNVCKGHGKCVAPEICSCEEGYYSSLFDKEQCDNWFCYSKIFSNPGVCNGKGKCVDFNECECKGMYYSKECERNGGAVLGALLGVFLPLGSLLILFVIFSILLCFCCCVCCVLSIFGIVGILIGININTLKTKLGGLDFIELIDPTVAQIKMNKSLFEVKFDEIKVEKILGEGGSRAQ